jgi:hypothetical protein
MVFLVATGASPPILADDPEVRIGRYQTVRSEPEDEQRSCINVSAEAATNVDRGSNANDSDGSAEDSVSTDTAKVRDAN